MQTSTTTSTNDPTNKFHDIKTNITIKAYLNPKSYFSQSDRDDTEFYAKIMLYLIAGSITLQMTIGAVLNKGIAPVFIIILTWQ